MEILKIIIWPVITFFSFLSALLFGLKLKSAKIGGSVVEFQNTTMPMTVNHDGIASRTGQFDLAKPGNIFWLGHDLMWTIDALYRGADKNSILHGLNQCAHHFSQIAENESSYLGQIVGITETVRNTENDKLNHERRVMLAQEINSLLHRIGGSIGAMQPNLDVGHPEGKTAKIS